MTSKYGTAWNNSDIVFMVENEPFHCHYSILSFCSPVFQAMFRENCFSEGRDKRTELPGKKRDVFEVFLDLLYPLVPGYDMPTNRTILEKVLEYADEYQVQSVNAHIDINLSYAHYKVKRHNIVQLVEDLKLSAAHNLPKYKNMCLQSIIESYEVQPYEKTIFKDLSYDLKYHILCGKIKKTGLFNNDHRLSDYAIIKHLIDEELSDEADEEDDDDDEDVYGVRAAFEENRAGHYEYD